MTLQRLSRSRIRIVKVLPTLNRLTLLTSNLVPVSVPLASGIGLQFTILGLMLVKVHDIRCSPPARLSLLVILLVVRMVLAVLLPRFVVPFVAIWLRGWNGAPSFVSDLTDALGCGGLLVAVSLQFPLVECSVIGIRLGRTPLLVQVPVAPLRDVMVHVLVCLPARRGNWLRRPLVAPFTSSVLGLMTPLVRNCGPGLMFLFTGRWFTRLILVVNVMLQVFMLTLVVIEAVVATVLVYTWLMEQLGIDPGSLVSTVVS